MVCENITLLEQTFKRNILSVQKYMLRFFNCTVKIGYFFTIEGHCSLKINVIPVSFTCQAMTELSFINLIDINIKLRRIVYTLLQHLPTYLELCRECNRHHCGPYCPRLD